MRAEQPGVLERRGASSVSCGTGVPCESIAARPSGRVVHAIGAIPDACTAASMHAVATGTISGPIPSPSSTPSR